MLQYKGNNRGTSLINGEQHFILHSTSIVILKSKSIVLNNGGYFSRTSKKALNEVGDMLGFQVYQEKFNWFVKYNGEVLEFNNGMELTK